MNYTNKDYYDYILKIDSVDNPLHKTYQKIVNFLLEEGLDKTISNEVMKVFVKTFRIRQYQLKEENINELNTLLYYDSAYRRAIKNDSGIYSIYPELKELPTKDDLLQYYSLKLKMNVKEIIDFLKPLINAKKIELKQSKVDTYYGDPKYLILRTKVIYDAIILLSNRNDVEDKYLVNQTLLSITSLLNTMLNTVGLEKSEETYSELEKVDYRLQINKNQYDFIRKCYVEVLEQENKLVYISNKIWQSYALKNNGVFIHQLTAKAVESDKMDKICTSFYSDNVNIVTKHENGNIGYAYPMNIESIFTVSETDVGSWRVTKEEYIEKGMPEKWQLDETNLWYEEPHHSKLFLPEYVENQVINNGTFAEIIIDNRKKNIKPLYCFYTSEATDEQIEEMNRLAKIQGLELKYLKTKEDKMTK